MKRLLPIFFSVFLALPALAVKTEWVSQNSFKEFVDGDAKQVEVTDDGFLKLGPAVSQWVSLQETAIWDVEPDGQGGYFVSAGNEGKIYRVDSSGAAKLFHQTKELDVYALAVDKEGNLYCGSSPDGKVYRVGKDGKAEVWFEPKQKYIWSLQFDAEGRLFVGTGETGILYRVSGKGKGDVFYDSDEKHIRTLFLDSKKRLWAGSEPGGLVFRFEDLGKNGASPRVIYDSRFKEVKAFAEDEAGHVFAAIMGDGKAKPKSAAAAAAKDAFEAMKDVMKEAGPGMPLPALPVDLSGVVEKEKRKPSKEEAASEVVRISPSDEVEFWGADTAGIFALAPAGGEKIWAGTSDSAKFYEANNKREFALLGQLEAGEVTAFVSDAQSKKPALLASSHPAGLWKVTEATAKTGTFESASIDARAFTRWGRLEAIGNSDAVKWSTRSGNTPDPDKAWSDWADLDNGKIKSPSSRYLQYKLEMSSDKNLIDEVRVFYMPFNQRPLLSNIQINQSGIEITKATRPEMPPTLTPSSSGSSSAASKSSKSTGAVDLGPAMGAGFAGFGSSMMPVRKPGYRSATWQAKDPDDDTMIYKAEYRSAGEKGWKLLEKNLKESFVSWDASSWPDGEYYLQITASDSPSNVPGEEKIDTLVSDIFLVDNTSPVVQGSASGDELKLTATDASSIIKYAEISVDGDLWRPILSDDGLLDDKKESFTYSIKDLKPGSHYAVFRVKDQADNEASITVKFKK